MDESEYLMDSLSYEQQENEVNEVGEVDSSSTNENNRLDGENDETNEEEEQDTPSFDVELELNEELQAGYKILSDLMSHSKRAANWPFMESVEVSAPDLYETYKQRIEKPVWLKLIKQKFEEHQYTTITEFVSDFRRMLENCYRFNGPDHYISKRAQKMETMLEQKLALLPRDLRDKTTIDATTEQKGESSTGGMGLRRRPKSHVLHDSTYLLNQLREAEYQKKREFRIRQIMARRAEREALAQEIMDWEDKVLFEDKKPLMKAMWEIPQIGLFLFLCQGPLNIGEVMHFELERCFMMPRESSTMQLIMTSLLSTPFQRLKIDKKNLMPYKVWEQKLRLKLETWYKTYTDGDNDVDKACNKLGIEEQFFEVVGGKNPMERKRYHELSFYRRVWIMKSLCDHCLHVQDSLRETIEIQPSEDQREFLLGTDNYGQRYIHFPQFCGADVRIYRQAPVKYPKIEIKPDPFESKRKYPFVYKPPPLKKVKLKKKRHKSPMSKSVSGTPSPAASPLRQRPTRLRQAPKSVVPLQLLEEESITEGTDTVSSDSEGEEGSTVEDTSIVEQPEPQPGTSTECDPHSSTVNEERELDSRSVDRLSSGSDATLPYCDNSDSNSNTSSRDCSRDSSPYPSCSDLSLRYSSRVDRLSDVSQESSPCPSPAGFGGATRRSARLDRYSDTSRDASPLIFDSDFGLRRSSRNRARLKNIPPLRAARDLSNFLFDENSASNSSLAGENSLSGLGSTLFKDTLTSRRSSKSSEVTEDSNDCDIQVNKLFTNSRTSSSADLGENFHNALQKADNDINENMEDSLNDSGTFSKRDFDADITDSKDGVRTSESQSGLCNNTVTESEIQNHNSEAVKDSTTTTESLSRHNTEDDKDFNDNAIINDVPGMNEDINMADEIDQSENENNTNLEIELSSQNAAVMSNQSKLNVGDVVKGDNCEGMDNDDSLHEEVKVKVENNKIDSTSSIDGDIISASNNKCDVKTENNSGKVEKVKLEDTDELTFNNETPKDEDESCVKDNGLAEMETVDESNIKEEKVKSSDIKTESSDDSKAGLVKDEKKEIRKEESESEEERDEILPDSGEFEMIADNLDEIRQLSSQFAEPEPIVIRRGKKEQIQRPPPRKKNIVILHERIEYLLKELEPWESKLQQATRRARLRMRKEMEDYLLKPPDEKTEDWKSTDEETESGESDDSENEEEGTGEQTDKNKSKPSNEDRNTASNSRCSTPVKIEEPGEIDISHRGRLRKRRIIPNNVEDQLPSKKPKPPIKTETSQSTPTSNQPVIVQSSKTQLVDYADIIRQLKNSAGNTPILIKTTQGGRTVLTSVLPVHASSMSSSTTPTPSIQAVRIISPSAGSGPVSLSQLQPQAIKLSVSSSSMMTSTSKALQHPTIQNLLSGTVAGTILLPKTSANTAVSVTGNGISIAQTTVSCSPTPEKNLAQKIVPSNQTTPQKQIVSPVATTPRRIAPHTTASLFSPSKPKEKYYAANASTLPINVVQQLIATRGAKLSEGPNKQSILLIPMESEGQSRNVVSHVVTGTVKNQISTVSEQQVSPDTLALSGASNTLNTTPKSSTNTLILPKPDLVCASPVLTLAQALPPGIQIQPGLAGLQRHRAFLQPAVVDGVNVTRLVHVGIPPKSPTRYPTNETVKTLLEKRKPVDGSGSKIATVLNDSSVSISPGSIASVRVTGAPTISPQISPAMAAASDKPAVVGGTASTISPVARAVSVPTVLDTLTQMSAVKPQQQCVITSISAAKLNTLLLQTTAAGAKSIPSLIKLPSKAALDSAVKAVVTSVNITLPTVNIKVPSPTSLPSIGPRRNVTKTIQTMKSPIPVAPKVVTQSSGGHTILSCSDSQTAASSLMSASSASPSNITSAAHSLQTVSSIPGQESKHMMGKVTPQLLLTSKGVVQMGYVNTEGSESDGTSAVHTGNQAMLVQNSAGQYQLIQANAANLQQLANQSSTVPLQGQITSPGQTQALLQGVQSMVALNANGNPVLLPTVRPNPQGVTNSSPPSIVLHNSTYYAAPRKPAPIGIATTSPTPGSSGLLGSPAVAGSTDIRPSTPGFVIQQPSSAVLQPAASPLVSQAGMVSPLLNLQQGLVLQGGGVQLAGNALVNPVGLNILQSGLALQNAANLQAVSAASPGINLLQKAVSGGATPSQLLNINPMLLNQSLSTTSTALLNQQQNGRSVIGQVNSSVTNLTSSVPRMNINSGIKLAVDSTSLQVKSLTGLRPTLTSSLPANSLVSPVPQMMQVQGVQGSSLIIPSLGAANQQLNLLGQLAATPNTSQKQLVFQYPNVSQVAPPHTAAVTQFPTATTSKTKMLTSLGNHQTVTPTTTRMATPQMSIKTEQTGNGTAAAVNQVNVQRTSPTQQKLLLFSIGGQLVTGHGVPVTLCDGVLKVVPHGKIKINNQTLTSEQIKQTLAKINEAAAMTLNPSVQQQTQVQQSGTSNGSDQSKVIPVKIVKDSASSVPCAAAVDHNYLNVTKDKMAANLVNGNTRSVSISPFQKCSEVQNSVSNHSNISQNMQTGSVGVNSDKTNESVDQSNNKTLIMKPMVYSSGYVVHQKQSDHVEMGVQPGSANQNFNIGKLVVDKEAKGFVVKAPVRGDQSASVSASGDASYTGSHNHNIKTEVKHEVDDDTDDKLVIDDDDNVSEKEAALNLLTLANQALS